MASINSQPPQLVDPTAVAAPPAMSWTMTVVWSALIGIIGINVYLYWKAHGSALMETLKHWFHHSLLVVKPVLAPPTAENTKNTEDTAKNTEDTKNTEGMCSGKDKCDPSTLPEVIDVPPPQPDQQLVPMGSKSSVSMALF